LYGGSRAGASLSVVLIVTEASWISGGFREQPVGGRNAFVEITAQAGDDASDRGLAANDLVEAVVLARQVADEFAGVDLEALQDWRDVVGNAAGFFGVNGTPTPVQQHEVVIQREGQAGVVVHAAGETQQAGDRARQRLSSLCVG